MSCYVKNANSNEPYISSAQRPCTNTTTTSSSSSNSFTQCCNPTDTCGTNGFCHFTHAQDAPVTGYYLGGCTDPSFEDPIACAQRCTSDPTQDVIFDEENGLWACCYGSGELDCRVPSDETFAAPGPEELFAVSSSRTASASATASSGSVTATTASPSVSTSAAEFPSSSPSSAASDSSSSGDDNTTTIAVAVAVPVVVILAVVVAFLLWRRRRHRQCNDAPGHRAEGWQTANQAYNYNRGEKSMAEMNAVRDPGELDSRVRVGELPGDGPVKRVDR